MIEINGVEEANQEGFINLAASIAKKKQLKRNKSYP